MEKKDIKYPCRLINMRMIEEFVSDLAYRVFEERYSTSMRASRRRLEAASRSRMEWQILNSTSGHNWIP